ncbi:hypothetical protein [Bacillus sp. FSL K6-3431]|uniref:hypothetical protein n=1 Tax=Bacillus sp. FSL K6-3431 TaxID=2921500 RepID=UPI0030FAD378
MVDKKAARIQIGDLLDKCKGCPKYETVSRSLTEQVRNCSGCSVFEELRDLSAVLDIPNDVKIQSILCKGPDMSLSEVTFLLECEINRRVLQKALKMGQPAFYSLLEVLGFYDK